MNLLQMKYAIVIAEKKSINRAADVLFVGQSALSRAVKELESSLGVTLFERSAKGMVPTAEGEIFIRHAKEILQKVDLLEAAFLTESLRCGRFSVCVPRQAYFAAAFARFSSPLADREQIQLCYSETDTEQTVQNILGNNCKLGIVEYSERYQKYFEAFWAEKNLAAETIASFSPVAVFSERSPLAESSALSRRQLSRNMQVCFSSSEAVSFPWMTRRTEQYSGTGSTIFVSDRAGLYSLLGANPAAVHFCAPTVRDELRRYALVQRSLFDEEEKYFHVLIHPREYQVTPLDAAFLKALRVVWEEVSSDQT